MKKLVSTLSLFTCVAIFSFLPFSMTSCTKETTIIEKDTIVQKDTVIVKDTIVRVDTVAPVKIKVKLTDNSWKIDEIRSVQSNTNYYYKRGASSGNTFNFDNEYIKFNIDKTGEYFADGYMYSLTWDYLASDSSQVRYTVAYPKPLIVTWERIKYYKDYITYSEYYTKEGMNTLSTVKRIPK